MGSSQGIDNYPKMQELFRFLEGEFQAGFFVETGTFWGRTAYWAAREFDRAFTIELSDAMYEKASETLATRRGLDRHLGDSRAHLPRILKKLGRQPAIFWLDAHWSAAETAGASDECPLLEEIALILGSSCLPLIVIDDARFFTEAPPPPHDEGQWPRYEDVVATLDPDGKTRFVTVYEDAIVAIPRSHRANLEAFMENPDAYPLRERRKGLRRFWRRLGSRTRELTPGHGSQARSS